jgi:hypothetical protein
MRFFARLDAHSIPELDHMHWGVVMARNSSLMTFQLTAYALVPNGGLKHAGRAATARAHTYRQLGISDPADLGDIPQYRRARELMSRPRSGVRIMILAFARH